MFEFPDILFYFIPSKYRNALSLSLSCLLPDLGPGVGTPCALGQGWRDGSGTPATSTLDFLGHWKDARSFSVCLSPFFNADSITCNGCWVRLRNLLGQSEEAGKARPDPLHCATLRGGACRETSFLLFV